MGVSAESERWSWALCLEPLLQKLSSTSATAAMLADRCRRWGLKIMFANYLTRMVALAFTGTITNIWNCLGTENKKIHMKAWKKCNKATMRDFSEMFSLLFAVQPQQVQMQETWLNLHLALWRWDADVTRVVKCHLVTKFSSKKPQSIYLTPQLF